MLSRNLDFEPQRDSAILAELPPSPAVFLLQGAAGTEPYAARTANLRRRLARLLSPPEERSRRLNLRHLVRRIEFTSTGGEFESTLVLCDLLRRVFPGTYRDKLRLRPAPLIKLNLENPYPRAYVTTRLGRLGGHLLYYGPFRSRAAAEKYLSDSLDFFKMRRCDFDLAPDPAFPGCIYSEMKMCLAPCFKGCTDDAYRDEVARVQQYLDSSGRTLEQEMAQERERASAELAFETAAGVHHRLEKVHGVSATLPEAVRRIDRLGGVVVQPSAEAGCVALFPFYAGCFAPAIAFPVQATQDGRSHSMEARLREALLSAEAAPSPTAQQTLDHLAIFKRWYYRSSRVGEVFFSDGEGELPLRRLVRGVSRVYRGEKAAEAAADLPRQEAMQPDQAPEA